jgi:hypothetical protein
MGVEGVTAAESVRARAAVVAVALAVVGAAGTAGSARADALMPDGERIDAVVRAGKAGTTLPEPDAGHTPSYVPADDSSSGVNAPEAIAAMAGVATVAFAAGVLTGRRRLRPA